MHGFFFLPELHPKNMPAMKLYITSSVQRIMQEVIKKQTACIHPFAGQSPNTSKQAKELVATRQAYGSCSPFCRSRELPESEPPSPQIAEERSQDLFENRLPQALLQTNYY